MQDTYAPTFSPALCTVHRPGWHPLPPITSANLRLNICQDHHRMHQIYTNSSFPQGSRSNPFFSLRQPRRSQVNRARIASHPRNSNSKRCRPFCWTAHQMLWCWESGKEVMVNYFSRCWRTSWYVLECLPLAEMLRWSQSALSATAMCPENVYLFWSSKNSQSTHWHS